MTRIDGKGGSRIVACPECGAAKGERCYIGPQSDDDFARRRNSHVQRVGKATAVIEKRERSKRLSGAATEGVRDVLAHVQRFVCTTIQDERVRGRGIGKQAAIDALTKLIRTRGER